MEGKVYAFTASLPQREGILKRAVASIIGQVDHIQVVLNNFKSVPNWLKNPKISVVLSDNSMEDGSRFIGIENAPEGYTLVFDDDIIYPTNYVKTLKKKLDKYAMVCPMGKIMKPRPLQSYYQDIEKSFKTFSEITQDSPVDIPGACGIMWDNRKVKVTESIIKIPNSDVCLGVFCKQNGITPVVIAHGADWMRNIFTNGAPSIFGKYRRNDKVMTDFINLNM